MITEFVLISFASFICWQLFRNLMPFVPVNAKTAPVIALCLSYGMTYLSKPSVLIALAATGGVALLNKVTDAPAPEFARLPVFSRKLKLQKVPASSPKREVLSL